LPVEKGFFYSFNVQGDRRCAALSRSVQRAKRTGSTTPRRNPKCMLLPLPLILQKCLPAGCGRCPGWYVETHRLTRTQFERWFANREVGSGHHGSLRLGASLGEVAQSAAALKSSCCRRIRPRLREAQQDRRRRCLRACWKPLAAADIVPVRVKSVEQQALAGPASHPLAVDEYPHLPHQRAARLLPRVWSGDSPGRAHRRRSRSAGCWPIPNSSVPTLIRGTMKLLVEEIRLLEARIAQLERELTALAKQSPACTTLLSIPGVGLLTATAMVAATGGRCRTSRMPGILRAGSGSRRREFSSGNTRILGRISKRGDRYLRMLAHPWRAFGAASCGHSPHGGAQPRRLAHLGHGGASPHQSQQGGLCVGQQAGTHLLRHLARCHALRSAGAQAATQDGAPQLRYRRLVCKEKTS
jgi:transposase